MQRMARVGLLAVGMLCSLGGCMARLRAIEKKLDDLEATQQKREAAQQRWNQLIDDELKHAWASAFCKEDVQNFLTQCRAAERARKEGTGDQIDPGLCPAKKKDHILTFMSTQRHEVVYFKRKDGLSRILAYRTDALRQLVRGPWLTTTKFLVLGRPVPNLADAQGDAEGRVAVVEQFLKQQLKVPADRIMGPWTFAFGVTDEEMDKSTRPNDVPQRGEPNVRALGVWVFRVDC